ncbi:MAG: DUF6079 family protein [bacterium]
MNYGELLQFDPIEDSVRLCEADQEGATRRFVSSYLISPEMAGRLTQQVFPRLQFDHPADPKALFVVGPHGAGKSHLLAVLSSLAERGELVDAVTNRKALTVDGAAALDAIAGRFLVIRAELGPATKSMRDALLRRMEGYLAAQGVAYAFPPDSKSPGDKRSFDDMMAAFHGTFPDHGLLLVVDELFDYLKSRNPRDLVRDLNFLRDLGEACRNLKFRFMAGVQESLFDHPHFTLAEDCIHRLKHRCAEVAITTRDAQFVAAARIVRKTPEQRALVEAHLARYAKYYGRMKERMDEFVDLFPIHPDYVSTFERNVFAERRGILRMVSDAVEKRLGLPLPENEPGLIAYDSYWVVLRAYTACREAPEIAAVIDFSRLLEERMEQSTMPAEDRAMARRIIHALSIQRLTAGDVYCERGVTPAELRDSLCLYQPGLDVTEGDPAEALLARAVRVLEEIRLSANGPIVTVRFHENRYWLHFEKFRRFVVPELILHWVNAIPFLLLMLTGGIMLASRFSHLDRELFSSTVVLHKMCALVWLCGLPLTVLASAKPHWAHIRTMFTWGVADAIWMIQSIRSLYNKKAVIPPADRFNTGQKINACLVMLYYFGFATTGLLMFWKGTILFPWYVHTSLFFAAMGSVGGHLFLALINPSTRIALAGIFHGWAPMKYVGHHHALSLPKSLRSHAEPVSVRTITKEVFVSRMELGILAVTVLLAGLGAFAFGQGRLATVEKQFAKSFADIIQPSELSTRHRIGPAAESCTKCHLFTGEIPDQKCEQCHELVKERRAAHIGYHGSLKGDCRYCHREHHELSVPLAPLARDTFDHNEAAFKLVGKHAKIQCDDCHKKTRTKDTPGIYYMGMKHERCADCHRDQHGGQFAAACDTCHTPAGWTGQQLLFIHDKGSGFHLEGKHAKVDCAKCHKPSTPSATLGSAKFKGLSHDCADCHQDPHRGQFDRNCTKCHPSPAAWTVGSPQFEHDRDTKFILLGKHATVRCILCHKPQAEGGPLSSARFKGLETTCEKCHAVQHPQRYGATCTACHAPDAWPRKQPVFDHKRDFRFELIGKHLAAQCSACHNDTVMGAVDRSRRPEYTCLTCHQKNDPHQGALGAICSKCHSTMGWKGEELLFDHTSMSRFPLNRDHVNLDCKKCHKDNRWKPLDPACASCHPKFFLDGKNSANFSP